MEYCIGCTTDLNPADNSGVCLRCEAEEAWDYDADPTAEFDRGGRLIETVEVEEDIYNEIVGGNPKFEKKLFSLAHDLEISGRDLEGDIDNAIKALSILWEEEPLDGDQTKKLAKLIRMSLDEANGVE